ncbi:hypothetical protein FI667_g1179, partial [Globisporangium splendens]
MRTIFSGLFLAENVVEKRWQCHVCCSWNEVKKATLDANAVSSSSVASEDQESTCKVCSRARHPSWLFVKKRKSQVHLTTLRERQTIDFVRKEAELLCVKWSVDQSKLDFTERVVNEEQVQELEPLHALEENHWSSALSEHGMCKDCRRVFHVSQRDLQSKHANQEILDALLAEVDVLKMQKQHYIKEKKHESVLQVTTQLHEKQKQIQATKRQLEFLSSLFCPYCGWSSITKGTSP